MKPTQFTRLLGIAALLASFSAAASTGRVPTYRVVDHIPGPDGGWDFVDFDARYQRLYVARSDAITMIDLKTRSATQLARASGGHQVLVLAQGKEVLETDGKTNRARFFDATSGTLLGEVATGLKPDAAVLDPATGLLLVMNAGDGTVSFIDPVKRMLIASLDVGGSLEVAGADGRGLVYVNVEDRNQIAAIDTRKRSIVKLIALDGCDGPTGLAIIAGGTRLISACANGVAVVTNPATGKVTDRIAIDKGPDGLLYDARRGVALVPTGEGYLDVITARRAGDIHRIARVATHASARTAALDPATGRVYLPSADYLAPVGAARRGAQVPGSFQVIVAAPAAQ